MGRSREAEVIRTADEFDIRRLSKALAPPKTGTIPLASWTLAEIFAARDDQMRGYFYRPARLAESMRTDDALAVAFENRLAPQRIIPVTVDAAKGARGASIAREAAALYGQGGVALSPATLGSIHGCLVNHDVAFAQVRAMPREDGKRVDLEVRYWPIDHVRWDPLTRQFMARVDPETLDAVEGITAGGEVPIVHGDGRWIIFSRYEHEPFKYGAILSAAIVWARHAYAIRDWSKGSVAHGSAKVIGELPAGVPIQDAEGSLSPEAEALSALLREVASGDAPAGIKPSGSKVDFLTNTSTAWQVWSELVSNAEKAAARIYLGTDGMLGAQGGAPGVDVQALFGVAATRVQSDLACISEALHTGLLVPWCAINFGDSSLVPTRRYLIPDGDADAARESLAKRRVAFFDDIAKARANGFAITQDYVNSVAEQHGVEAPMLPADADKGPSVTLAPTDLARVVSVNEARASAGLGPLLTIDGQPDPDGRLTVEAYAAKSATTTAAPTPATPNAGVSPEALARGITIAAMHTPEVFRGPPGRDGAPGQPGPPGRDGEAVHLTSVQRTFGVVEDLKAQQALGLEITREMIIRLCEQHEVDPRAFVPEEEP